ncbi:hypothetical protein VPUCM_0035 [Vibrio parahaemolyticus UCM-V493]|nr:hypothetical protein VPUCM_0035 [Vibrio parahaemolyticus UCM-V493]
MGCQLYTAVIANKQLLICFFFQLLYLPTEGRRTDVHGCSSFGKTFTLTEMNEKLQAFDIH